MIKRLAALIIVSVLFVYSHGFAAEGGADKPLMVINNTVSLTVAEFYDFLMRLENKLKFRPSVDKQKEILGMFVNQELLYADAAKKGYDKDEDLQKRFEAALKSGYANKLTMPKQEEWLRKRFIVEQYLEDFRKKSVSVSDDEALEYYEKNKQKYIVPELFTGFFYTVQPLKDVDEKTFDSIVEKVKKMIIDNGYSPIDFFVMEKFSQDNPDFNIVLYKVAKYDRGNKKKGISVHPDAVRDFMKLSPKTLAVTKAGNDSIISVLTEKSQQRVMPFADVKNEIVLELSKTKYDAAIKALIDTLTKQYKPVINYELLK